MLRAQMSEKDHKKKLKKNARAFLEEMVDHLMRLAKIAKCITFFDKTIKRYGEKRGLFCGSMLGKSKTRISFVAGI